MDATKNKTIRKFRSLLIALAAVIIFWGGVFAYFKIQSINEANKRYPLNTEIEYVGKTEYGCWLPVCDAALTSVYYYGTDLSAPDVIRQFKKATIDNPGNLSSSQSSDAEVWFSLKAPNGNVFYLSYYAHGQAYANQDGIYPKQKHLITLSKDQYQAAKASL